MATSATCARATSNQSLSLAPRAPLAPLAAIALLVPHLPQLPRLLTACAPLAFLLTWKRMVSWGETLPLENVGFHAGRQEVGHKWGKWFPCGQVSKWSTRGAQVVQARQLGQVGHLGQLGQQGRVGQVANVGYLLPGPQSGASGVASATGNHSSTSSHFPRSPFQFN